MTDPDGKCPICVPAGLGALENAAFQIAINNVNDDPWDKDVVQEMAVGAAVGATGVGVVKLADKGLETYRAVKAVRAAIQESGERFKKAPKGSGAFKTEKAANGATKFSYETPGRVPGSKAVYEKTVDRTGKTIDVKKTTIDPKGDVAHTKDKLIRKKP